MEREIYHVLPNNDTEKHVDTGLICDCNPEVKIESENFIVIHNAYDGREWEELKNISR